MSNTVKRDNFYANGGGTKVFHIETDGCIVNITVGLTDNQGRQVTRVDVIPDDESRGGDGEGRIWHQESGDPRVICVKDPARESA